MKRFNLSGWAVSHPTLILFLMIALGAAGYFSYQRLGRAEDPFFTVKVVNVSAIWPGATAQEMQTQVADPIEKKLQELPYFEKVQTYSKPAFTAMQVTFKDSTPPKDVPYLFYMLRKKLADAQGALPANLLGPVVNDGVSRARVGAFEVEDGIDEVFEETRPSDLAGLGDVAGDDRRDRPEPAQVGQRDRKSVV